MIFSLLLQICLKRGKITLSMHSPQTTHTRDRTNAFSQGREVPPRILLRQYVFLALKLYFDHKDIQSYPQTRHSGQIRQRNRVVLKPSCTT